MEIVHVLNRGVDKREIFLDDQDRYRFIHDLFEFNDDRRINSTSYYFYNSFNQSNDLVSREIGRKKRRDFLVTIHCFCIMPNHYHLLLSPEKEDGVSKFMRKLNMGYAKYFNERYKRVGALFEGRYKSILVERDAHFIHLPYYIHFNPLDLITPEWREGKIKNYRKALEFLESYRWSSHLDYLGKKNFPSVTQRELILDFFGNEHKYRESVKEWLHDIDIISLKEKSLE